MKNFIDLSSEWSLKSPEWENGRTIPATLPGDNYSALLEAGAIPDPYFGSNETIVQEFRKYEWEFEREFEVPSSLLEYDSVYLNVEQLDTFGTIFIRPRSRPDATSSGFTSNLRNSRQKKRRSARSGKSR